MVLLWKRKKKLFKKSVVAIFSTFQPIKIQNIAKLWCHCLKYLHCTASLAGNKIFHYAVMRQCAGRKSNGLDLCSYCRRCCHCRLRGCLFRTHCGLQDWWQFQTHCQRGWRSDRSLDCVSTTLKETNKRTYVNFSRMSPKLVQTYPCIVENRGITMEPLFLRLIAWKSLTQSI